MESLKIAFNMLFIFIPCSIIFASDEILQDNNLTFGVLPYLSPAHMAETYAPVVSDISQKTGLKINFRTASNFQQFMNNLYAERYDIVIVQPFDVELATKKLNYVPVATPKNQLKTVIVTKKSSNIQSLEGLRGKVVSFAPKNAATSRVGLQELRVNGLFDGEAVIVEFSKNQDSCLHDIIIGKAEACVTGPPIVIAFEKRRNVKFKTIHESEPIPHMGLMIHARVAEEVKNRVISTVTEWDKSTAGMKILDSLRFPAWIKTDYTYFKSLELYPKPTSLVYSGNKNFMTLGVFPYVTPKQLAELLAPVPTTLSKVLESKVYLRTSSNYQKFRLNVQQSLYDFLFVHPYDLKLALNNGYIPVLQMDHKLTAVVYVRNENSVKTLADLKGRIIALPPRESSVAILGTNHLNEKGLKPHRDIRIIYRRTHESCLDQLLADNVSACISTSLMVTSILNGKAKDHIRSISESESIPSLVLMLSSRLEKEIFQKVSKEVMSWGETKKGKKMLQKIRLKPFIKYDERDFKKLVNS